MSGEHRELCDQSITVCNGKPAAPPKAFAHTVREFEHQDVVSSAIVVEEFLDKHSWQWMKQAFTTFWEAMESYMIEVVVESHI